MTKQAWYYIAVILATASLLVVLGCATLTTQANQFAELVILAALATAAQIWKARAPGHQSYHPSILFMFAGALVLPQCYYGILVIVPHLVEWVTERATASPRLRQWYLQPFNMAVHIIAGVASRIVFDAIAGESTWLLAPTIAAAGAVAALVYVILNHTLIGQAIVLGRGVSWQETGILDLTNLTTDFVMLCLGQVVAFLFQVNAWLILPALAPLVLMYRALMIPQLQKEAQTDAKTGLLNARTFVRALEEELERSKRHGRTFALIMADLDLLRNINNTYGHLAGDEVLVTTARVIQDSVRVYDLAARFGGEEFVVVLPETNLKDAKSYSERLRQTILITRVPVKTSDTPLSITLSLGIAMFPADGRTAEALIHEADIAVYQAKRQGRNQVVCASEMPLSAKQNIMPSGERTSDVSLPSFTPRPMPKARAQADTRQRQSRE